MQFDDLSLEVLPDVPGCPSFTIERALRDAAIDLCERAHIWQHQSDPVPTEPDGTLYLDTPASTRIVDLLSVIADERSVMPIHKQDVERRGIRGGYQRLSDDQISFVGINPASASFRVAVAPVLASTGMPDEIIGRWAPAIVRKAKSYLMSMPGMVWTNPQLGMFHASYYETELNRAMLRASQDGNLSARRVRIRPAA